MAAFSEEIVEIKCDPHKILNNTYLYRFFCSKFKSFHNVDDPIRNGFSIMVLTFFYYIGRFKIYSGICVFQAK